MWVDRWGWDSAKRLCGAPRKNIASADWGGRREGERGEGAPVNNFKNDPFRHTLGARGFSPISLILHASRDSYNFFIIFALCDLIEISFMCLCFLFVCFFLFDFVFLLLQLLKLLQSLTFVSLYIKLLSDFSLPNTSLPHWVRQPTFPF